MCFARFTHNHILKNLLVNVVLNPKEDPLEYKKQCINKNDFLAFYFGALKI